MSLLLGCIADDFTGATDLANMLVKGGMRTMQYLGVPEEPLEDSDADAIVIALKSRTIAADEAIHQSISAVRRLKTAGARQIFFKYCSTFDSTDQGNIGPVIEALMDEVKSDFTVACPAAPENGRTVYQGHLFVHGALLSESGMQHHPLTPMKDANLVRVLERQVKEKAGLIPYDIVNRGIEAIKHHMNLLRKKGIPYAIVDALEEEHLLAIGAACEDLPLVTGGSGMAMGLPENFRRQGLLPVSGNAVTPLPTAPGRMAVLAGSCSEATRLQVNAMKKNCPSYQVDPRVMTTEEGVADILKWAKNHLHTGPILIYSSAPPEQVADIQRKLGKEEASARTEQILARTALALTKIGVTRMIVAGGETSGAVVSALSIRALRIGPEIAPGVPWTIALPSSLNAPTLCLALKSGNFGGEHFFSQALDFFNE